MESILKYISDKNTTHVFNVPLSSLQWNPDGLFSGWYVWDAKKSHEYGPFTYEKAYEELGKLIPLSEEKIKQWLFSLEGLDRFADDTQDVKAANVYFSCKRLLEIMREISGVLERELG